MRSLFVRACATASLAGIVAALWLHLDVALGPSETAQPILLCLLVLIFPVWLAALSVATHVARKENLYPSFFPRPREIVRLIRGVTRGAPRWVVVTALLGIAGSVLLPGHGRASLPGELTPEELRVGANVCLFFLAASAPILFSSHARLTKIEAAV